MTFIGLDIGTTGCKAVLFDEDGACWPKPAENTRSTSPTPHGPSRMPSTSGSWRKRRCGAGRGTGA